MVVSAPYSDDGDDDECGDGDGECSGEDDKYGDGKMSAVAVMVCAVTVAMSVMAV